METDDTTEWWKIPPTRPPPAAAAAAPAAERKGDDIDVAQVRTLTKRANILDKFYFQPDFALFKPAERKNLFSWGLERFLSATNPTLTTIHGESVRPLLALHADPRSFHPFKERLNTEGFYDQSWFTDHFYCFLMKLLVGSASDVFEVPSATCRISTIANTLELTRQVIEHFSVDEASLADCEAIRNRLEYDFQNNVNQVAFFLALVASCSPQSSLRNPKSLGYTCIVACAVSLVFFMIDEPRAAVLQIKALYNMLRVLLYETLFKISYFDVFAFGFTNTMDASRMTAMISNSKNQKRWIIEPKQADPDDELVGIMRGLSVVEGGHRQLPKPVPASKTMSINTMPKTMPKTMGRNRTEKLTYKM